MSPTPDAFLALMRRQMDLSYNETAAYDAYVSALSDVAKGQDLAESRQGRTRSLSVAFTVFAALFVIARFVARWRQRAGYLADDWIIVVALAMLIGNMGMNLAMINQGLGLHSGRLSLDELQKLDQTIMGAEILYVAGATSFKVSLLFLYYRLFPMPGVRAVAFIIGSVLVAWCAGCMVAAGFQCMPHSKIWEPWLQGTCIDTRGMQVYMAVPNIIVDVMILILPIPQVWHLQTNRTQRIFLTAIFMLGSYVLFSTIWRFKVMLDYTKADVPYTYAEGASWNVIEISSGIVSACLPTMGPFVRVLFSGINPVITGKRPVGNLLGRRSQFPGKEGTGANLFPLQRNVNVRASMKKSSKAPGSPGSDYGSSSSAGGTTPKMGVFPRVRIAGVPNSPALSIGSGTNASTIKQRKDEANAAARKWREEGKYGIRVEDEIEGVPEDGGRYSPDLHELEGDGHKLGRVTTRTPRSKASASTMGSGEERPPMPVATARSMDASTSQQPQQQQQGQRHGRETSTATDEVPLTGAAAAAGNDGGWTEEHLIGTAHGAASPEFPIQGSKK